MPRPDNLGALLRTLVNSAVATAVAKARTPKVLSGVVEQLDDDLGVVHVRMDQEAMGGDPAQSLNYEYPGVIPATRLGETFTDEQVRVSFDGAAGASAMRTSLENVIVLPFGTEDGQQRIILDGNEGTITFYDAAGNLVGQLQSQQWSIGDLSTPGRRLTLDPLGGLRMRDETNTLVAILDQLGYSLRSGTTGLITAELGQGTLRLVDPAGNDSIEMATSSTGTLPNPSFRSLTEASPGSTIVAPTFPTFTTPVDDMEIDFAAAFLRGTSQVATMTPPASHTERLDANFQDAAGTLQSSVATLQPAVGADHTFTSSQSNWQHAIGIHVALRGGGTSSPSFRAVSSSQAVVSPADVVATTTIDKPTGTAQGDALITFVVLGVSGGLVPTGWTTPEGFVFLGADWLTTGSGDTQSTLAVGAWAKLAEASEPASYSTTISLPTGTKLIQGVMVAIQNAFLVPGGVQIRMAGKPIRRLLAFNEVPSPSATLCDFQDIPQGYDNLELVYDGTSTGSGSNIRVHLRFNGDTGNNYFYRITQNGSTTLQGFAVNAMRTGGISNIAASRVTGSLNIYGYASMNDPVMLGHAWHTSSLVVNDEVVSGQWNSTARINRILCQVEGTPANPRFAAGSRAYLYGY